MMADKGFGEQVIERRTIETLVRPEGLAPAGLAHVEARGYTQLRYVGWDPGYPIARGRLFRIVDEAGKAIALRVIEAEHDVIYSNPLSGNITKLQEEDDILPRALLVARQCLVDLADYALTASLAPDQFDSERTYAAPQGWKMEGLRDEFREFAPEAYAHLF